MLHEAGATLTLEPAVEAGVIREDNLFRLSPEVDTLAVLGTAQRDDWIRRFGLGITAAWTYGRQRADIVGTVQDVRFQTFDYLNYRADALQAQWKFPSGKWLDNHLGYRRSQTLSGFADLGTTERDVITTSGYFLDVTVLPYAVWQGYLKYAADDSTHSLASRQDIDYQSRRTSIGVIREKVPGNHVALEWTLTDVVYPNQTVSTETRLDDAYLQHDVGARLLWTPRPQARAQAQIHHTTRRYAHIETLDFRGITAAVEYTYSPRSTWDISFAGWRNLNSAQDSIARYIVSQGVSVTPSWTLSAAFSIGLRMGWEERDYRGDVVFSNNNVIERQDKPRMIAAWLSYRYRGFEGGVSIQQDTRDSNQEVRDYSARTFTATVRYRFMAPW